MTPHRFREIWDLETGKSREYMAKTEDLAKNQKARVISSHSSPPAETVRSTDPISYLVRGRSYFSRKLGSQRDGADKNFGRGAKTGEINWKSVSTASLSSQKPQIQIPVANLSWMQLTWMCTVQC